jgi:hypothetical protein
VALTGLDLATARIEQVLHRIEQGADLDRSLLVVYPLEGIYTEESARAERRARLLADVNGIRGEPPNQAAEHDCIWRERAFTMFQAAMGPEDFADADVSPDSGYSDLPDEIDGVDWRAAGAALGMLLCPWRNRVGICGGGCTTEPACETMEPQRGWADELRRAVNDFVERRVQYGLQIKDGPVIFPHFDRDRVEELEKVSTGSTVLVRDVMYGPWRTADATAERPGEHLGD